MSATTTVHLNFRTEAREALSFYQSVFGGETQIVTYGDAHSAADPVETDRVMWGQVESESGVRVMAYDVQLAKGFDRGENSFYVSVRFTEEAEIRAVWSGLVEGGDVQQNLGPSGWSLFYGMVQDRFGVVWVLDVTAPSPAA